MPRKRAADIERSLTDLLGQDSLLRRLGAAVVPGSARADGGVWYVAVHTARDPKRKFEYYERLSAIEDRMNEQTGIDILIAPSGLYRVN